MNADKVPLLNLQQVLGHLIRVVVNIYVQALREITVLIADEHGMLVIVRVEDVVILTKRNLKMEHAVVQHVLRGRP